MGRRILLSVGALAIFAVLPFAGVAAAEARAASATAVTGYDVSYPQCGRPLPSGGAFGVVGVTGGLPYSANPCLLTEWQWAAARGAPALYMNTANPAPHSSYYWPASGSSDPALCLDSTSTTDPGCAYDYGWHAAEDALATAVSTVGLAARSVTWWLDVETGNSWNGDARSNAADIQGAIDYLRSQGIPTVGVYSSAYQWNMITGGYNGSTASSYVAAWAPYFAPGFSIRSTPSWVAGALTLKGAARNCRVTLTGGPTLLAQYRSSRFDADLAC